MIDRRRRGAHVLFAAAVALAGLAVLLPAGPAPADPVTSAAAVTKAVTATRSFIDQDGKEVQQSSNRVKLAVSQVSNLRGRQEVRVSWTGAVPTGAVVGDPNSADGRNQEYPFVLLQCRGIDTTGKVPKGQARLTPETCWTQTDRERYLAAGHTPAWRFDAHATAADRRPVVGQPDPLPKACEKLSQPLTARWLPLRAQDGEVYYGGPDPSVGCAGLAPESDSAEGGGLPSNTTYGVTGVDGAGQTDFAVWTSAENASLGCSAAVKCSLVAVPVVGISCDAWGTKLPAGEPQTTRSGTPLSEAQMTAADTSCRRAGSYAGGEPVTGRSSDLAVTGNLWWSASNWRNRIAVPLDFAPTGEVCEVGGAEKPLELMGSVVLNELTASWRPRFCTSKDLFSFTHVQQADSLARDLLNNGEVKGAFTSAPRSGGYQRPVVQAPIAFGGFAVAFSIDDARGQRREQLKLNARLVAKLLSGSYPAVSFVKNGHVGLGDNPYNLTVDPEFQALNPGIREEASLESAATLQVLSTNSDLVWALTQWINADVEARAWLDGAADPWGMKVNPAYAGIDLPVDNWPLLDQYIAPDFYIENNACYKNSPTPYLQLVANPQSSLSAINVNLQYAKSAVATVCRYDGIDATTLPLRTQGRQAVGRRFVIGLVSLSAAQRYNLRTADLQTTSGVGAGERFSDASGRTFVTPNAAGLKSAAGLLKADAEAGTWVLDYPKFSTAAGRTAYPGAMPVYAVLPTSAEDEATATKLARFLCYAHDSGQKPGATNGALPVGYLPLSDANGFKAQRRFVLNAVAAVRAQEGGTPGLDAAAPAGKVCDFSVKVPAAPVTPTPTANTAPTIPDVPAAAAPSVEAAVTPAAAPATTPAVDAPIALTSGESSGFGRFGFVGLLALAALSALAGSVLRWLELLRAGMSTARGAVVQVIRR